MLLPHHAALYLTLRRNRGMKRGKQCKKCFPFDSRNVMRDTMGVRASRRKEITGYSTRSPFFAPWGGHVNKVNPMRTKSGRSTRWRRAIQKRRLTGEGDWPLWRLPAKERAFATEAGDSLTFGPWKQLSSRKPRALLYLPNFVDITQRPWLLRLSLGGSVSGGGSVFLFAILEKEAVSSTFKEVQVSRAFFLNLKALSPSGCLVE
uniref:Uncharacterized protein n=1 Tax=Cannabis sativa TaxID=3483 RepID=A0A803PXK6_CANSA